MKNLSIRHFFIASLAALIGDFEQIQTDLFASRPAEIPLEYEYQLDGIYYRYLYNGRIDVFLSAIPSALIIREENYFLINAAAEKAWQKKEYRAAAKIFPAALKFPCNTLKEAAKRKGCSKTKKNLNIFHQKFSRDARYHQYRKNHQIWKNNYLFYNDKYHLFAEDFGFHLSSSRPFYLLIRPAAQSDALIQMKLIKGQSLGFIYLILNPKLEFMTLTEFENQIKHIHLGDETSRIDARNTYYLFNEQKSIRKKVIYLESGSYCYRIWKSTAMGYIFKFPDNAEFEEIKIYLLPVSDI